MALMLLSETGNDLCNIVSWLLNACFKSFLHFPAYWNGSDIYSWCTLGLSVSVSPSVLSANLNLLCEIFRALSGERALEEESPIKCQWKECLNLGPAIMFFIQCQFLPSKLWLAVSLTGSTISELRPDSSEEGNSDCLNDCPSDKACCKK